MSHTPPDPPDQAGPVLVEAAGPPEAPPSKARRSWRGVIEWAVILAIAVAAALLLRAFVIQPYYIPSGSMEPTLEVGDKVLVNKLAYHFHPIHRGDVVVFAKPADDNTPGIKDLIKRVIGLPGESISASGGVVYINGHPLEEPWLPKGTTTGDFSPRTIPAGYYFVMGDNRGNSADSRVIGPIPRRLIVGSAFLIVWPLSRIGWL